MPKIDHHDSFVNITIDEVFPTAEKMKGQGARFMNLHATASDEGVILTYAYTTDEIETTNYDVLVKEGDVVPSISSLFLEAFVFENEQHDLFGVNIEGIAIDFQGNFYQVSVDKPMVTDTDETENYVAEKALQAGISINYTKGGQE